MLNLNTILHSLSTDEVIQSSVEDTLRKKEFPANKRSTTNIQYVSTANSRTVDHILSRCFRTLHNFNCFRRLCISQQLSNTEMMACPTSPRSTDKRLSPSRAFHTSQVRFASSIRASTRPLSPVFSVFLQAAELNFRVTAPKTPTIPPGKHARHQQVFHQTHGTDFSHPVKSPLSLPREEKSLEVLENDVHAAQNPHKSLSHTEIVPD